MAEPGGVSLTLDGSAVLVAFSAPPENLLGTARVASIEERLREASRRREVKVVAVAARGEDFCTGLDPRELAGPGAEGLVRAWHSLLRLLLTTEVPTVALVQGRALAAGAELALSCDFVFAETTATFGFPEIRLGLFPTGASVLLERRVGHTKAADLILSGAAMSADAAERRGLVNALVNPGDLVTALETVRDRLDPFSASSLRLAKRALTIGSCGDPLSALAAVERSFLRDLLPTEDAKEGLAALLAGREPAWKNR